MGTTKNLGMKTFHLVKPPPTSPCRPSGRDLGDRLSDDVLSSSLQASVICRESQEFIHSASQSAHYSSHANPPKAQTANVWMLPFCC